MRIIPSIRALMFALVMLAISGASYAQVGILPSPHQNCLSTSSRRSLAMAISGHRGTGLTVTTITTGCRVRG